LTGPALGATRGEPPSSRPETDRPCQSRSASPCPPAAGAAQQRLEADADLASLDPRSLSLVRWADWIAAVPRLVNSVLTHVKVGVPAAAIAHGVVHCVCEAIPARDLWLFPVYVILGTIFGSIVLAPAFALQALLVHVLSTIRVPLTLRAAAAGAMQSSFVWLWASTIGLEPSYGSWLPLTPWMMTAAFLVGAGTACFVELRGTRPIAGATTAPL
jgi:hypothetical protein